MGVLGERVLAMRQTHETTLVKVLGSAVAAKSREEEEAQVRAELHDYFQLQVPHTLRETPEGAWRQGQEGGGTDIAHVRGRRDALSMRVGVLADCVCCCAALPVVAV